MLPDYKTIAFPPLVVRVESRPLAALAAGVVEDLCLLVNRLGDVRALPMPKIPGDPVPRTEPRLERLDARELAALFADTGADFVLTGGLELLDDGFGLEVAVRRPDGSAVWSDRIDFLDGTVLDGRLVLAANVVEAVTGRRKDVRHARRGGTRNFKAYQRMCLSMFRRLPSSKRVRLLREAIELDPEYAEAYVLLADAQEKAGRRERARELLQQSAQRFPRFSWGRQRYGVALRVAGFPEGAVEEVQAALDTDPDGRTLFHAGLFAEAGGDLETAQTLYLRAVERGCVDAVLYDKLGGLRANAGEYEEAAALWRRALEVEPGFAYLLGHLALSEHHLGRTADAAALFEQALARAPGAFSTHANHAVLLQDTGRHMDAVEACGKALAIRPEAALMYNNRGVSRLALGDRAQARADFEAALSLEPGPDLATYARANLARLDRGSARIDQAVGLIRRASVLLETHKPKAAAPLLVEALDLYPDSWEGWLLLAISHRSAHDWMKAADAFAQVLRLRPDHAGALSERALTLLALGRQAEAVDHARLAVQVEPRDAGWRCNLGVVHMEAGQWDEARSALDEALDLDPGNEIMRRCRRELRRRMRKDPRWGETWIDETSEVSLGSGT
jgi:tetratricopeptide (TPR) repeat protein